MSDVLLPAPTIRPQPAHAVDALADLIASEPEDTLTLITLGPLTNVAAPRTHVSHAMVKLGTRDRAQLVVIAYQTGLVSAGS